MPSRSSKRLTDVNQLAKLIVDIATGESDDLRVVMEDGRDAAAVSLGRRGGLKGGRARANSLTAQERSDIASKAARARWTKTDD